jgi:FAD/FMN-containing dehydrogenase
VTLSLLRPGSSEYEAARRPAQLRYAAVRPQVIARCETPSDVAEALAEARRTGLQVAPRSGGHCFAGRSSTTGMLLDLSPMSSIDLTLGQLSTGPAARLTDLYDVLGTEGLTIPAGSGRTVAIAGLTLGGGIGFLGRRHGLTSDNLDEAEVVLADGRIVRCGMHENTDLYWAIRGSGGAQFGVLTRLSFIGLPSPQTHRFQLRWPVDHAAAVIDAWQDWAPYAPWEVNANVRVTPSAVHLFGVVLENTDPPLKSPESSYAEPRFDAVRDGLGGLDRVVSAIGMAPESAEIQQLDYRAASRSLAGLGATGDGSERVEFSKSAFFGYRMPLATWSELVDGLVALGDYELNLTPMGGEYNRITWTAFAHRDQAFLLELMKRAPVPELEEPVLAAAEAGCRAELTTAFAPVASYDSGAVYPNFPDPTLGSALRAYHGDNLSRLHEVKRQYDPDGFFRFPQSL